jgi:hypothetical protein
MRAFITSLVALVVIGFIAYSALSGMDRSAQSVFQSSHGSVRL